LTALKPVQKAPKNAKKGRKRGEYAGEKGEIASDPRRRFASLDWVAPGLLKDRTAIADGPEEIGAKAHFFKGG
jgi:hypothetical protein